MQELNKQTMSNIAKVDWKNFFMSKGLTGMQMKFYKKLLGFIPCCSIQNDLPDPVIPCIGNKKISFWTDGNGRRVIKNGRPKVTVCKTCSLGSRQSGYDPCWSYFSYAIID